MDKRQAWQLRLGDRVVYQGEIFTVEKNDQQANACHLVRDGWVECISWTYLKRAPKIERKEGLKPMLNKLSSGSER